MDDFDRMATFFGTSGRTCDEGNFNYDTQGNVDLDDFNILAGKFGTALPAPPTGGGQFTLTIVNNGTNVDVTCVDDQIGETGSRIQRSPDGINFTDTFSIANQAGQPDTGTRQTVITGQQDGKRYWLRLRAYSTGSAPNTAYSAKKGVTTALPPPVSLLVTRTGTTANLSWTVPSHQNGQNVIIQRSGNGFSWTTIQTQNIGQSTYANTGLSSGRWYYRVFFNNPEIDSAPSFVEYIDVP